MSQLSTKTIRAVQRYGPSVNAIARQYGISGAALLAKVIEGESGDDPNAVSTAGAKGGAQFMPGSRQTVLSKYGVDPWSSDPDQYVHAAALHLRGLVNGSKGLTGYNPGSPTYTGYILGQKVGDVSHYGGGTTTPTQPKTPSAPSTTYSTTTTTTPGVDNSASRRQLVTQFLQQGGVANRSAVLGLAANYGQAQDTPATTSTQTVSTKGKWQVNPSTATISQVSKLKVRGDRIDAQHRPYLWGGGHGGDSWGLDCSGFISKLLGVSPRVAEQFKSFGEAGKGKEVTIWAAKDGKHVLAEIDGHFIGTSKTNPGGGPGWIPRSAIPAAYLKRFTPRHPAGL